MSDESSSFSEAIPDSKKPWFVWLSFQAVHDPIEVGDYETFVTQTKCALIGLSTSKKDDDGDGDDGGPLSLRRTLCGMMAEVDAGVARIREHIDSLGAWGNTLVVYASDNGGLLAHGASNAPFAGEKGTYYEGGVHVPAFFGGGYLSRALKAAGAQSFTLNALVHITDLHVTLAGLAGYYSQDDDDGDSQALDTVSQSVVAEEGMDGVDLWPLLVPTAKATSAAREEVLINANSESFGGSGALRWGDYKVMVHPDPKEDALYRRVRAKLESMSLQPSKEILLEYVRESAEVVLKRGNGWRKVHVYNVVRNPGEVDLGDSCGEADLEACANLADHDEYTSLVENLTARLEAYRSAAAAPTFGWQDDGPLANPEFFGHLWSPWRDRNGCPLATYDGTTVVDDGPSMNMKSLKANRKQKGEMHQMKTKKKKALVTPALTAADTASTADAEEAYDVYTAVVFGGFGVVALVAVVAFNAGKRQGLRQGYYSI